MQTNPAVEQNLFAWCIQRSITDAWTNLCTKYPAAEKSALRYYRIPMSGNYTSCRMSILCVPTPEIKPVKPGFLPAHKPGFTGLKTGGLPGFSGTRVRGLHSLDWMQSASSVDQTWPWRVCRGRWGRLEAGAAPWIHSQTIIIII